VKTWRPHFAGPGKKGDPYLERWKGKRAGWSDQLLGFKGMNAFSFLTMKYCR